MSEIDAIPAPDSAAHVGCAASDCSRGEPMPDVPFDSLPTQKVTLRDGIGVVIPSGATLQVWQVEERDGFQIKIRRPLDDGTRSLLKFGLSRDAAIALHGLLQMQLYPENVKVDSAMESLDVPRLDRASENPSEVTGSDGPCNPVGYDVQIDPCVGESFEGHAVNVVGGNLRKITEVDRSLS